MAVDRRVVDNRVFLLGLDKMYRDAMKQHERQELLTCARRVAETLHVSPANVPVEGYYTEDPQLTEYFKLVRALQNVRDSKAPVVDALPEFQRLMEVVSAPLFGRPEFGDRLFPQGVDPLSQALKENFPDWTVKTLAAAACKTAVETDDFSLVGLAARVRDALVLTAARESVVLYAQHVVGSARKPPKPKYIWKVDEDLAEQARRFVDTFNQLFGEDLPAPDAEHARHYWSAHRDTNVLGRCVRLGSDDSTPPVRHYHWAICRRDKRELVVQEFWSTETWTTERYRSTLGRRGMCPDL